MDLTQNEERDEMISILANVDIPIWAQNLSLDDYVVTVEKSLPLTKVGIKSLRLEQPYLIIGDLHLNAEGDKDNFSKQRDLLYVLLTKYPPSKYGLILLGDIFDLWEEEHLQQIFVNNAWILYVLSLYDIIYIPGNHDEELEGMTSSNIFTQIAHTNILHGHQADPLCHGDTTLARLASKLWAWLEVVGIADWWIVKKIKRMILNQRNSRRQTLGKHYDEHVRTAKDDGYGNPNAFYEEYAMTFPEPIFIFGHTHQAMLSAIQNALDKQILANPGTWTLPGRGTALVLRSSKIELVSIVRRLDNAGGSSGQK